MVESATEGALPIRLLAPTGDGYQNRLATPRRRTNRCRELVAAHVRQSDVEQHYLGLQALCEFEPVAGAIGRAHAMSRQFQERRAAVGDILIVVDDHDIQS